MFKYPKPNDNNTDVSNHYDGVSSEWTDGASAASAFSTQSDSSDASNFDQAVATTSLPASASRNVLNQDVEVVGILIFKDDLLVDGAVRGRIESKGVLTVGDNALIEAGEKEKNAVKTKSVIIHGRVHGDIEVTDRVELASSAEVIGNITANKISVEEGAILVGQCRIGAPADLPSAAPAKAKQQATPVASKTPNLLG